LVIQLDGPATTALLRGEAVQAIVENPRVVQGAALSVTKENAGRRGLGKPGQYTQSPLRRPAALVGAEGFESTTPCAQGEFRCTPQTPYFQLLSLQSHASIRLLNPVAPGSTGQLQNHLQAVLALPCLFVATWRSIHSHLGRFQHREIS
jgi:hypothetical protein